MVLAVSFNSAQFKVEFGYLIRDISPTLQSDAFNELMTTLSSNPQAVTDIGISSPLRNFVLYRVLEQFSQPPVINGVKQIDTTVAPFALPEIALEDGFRDRVFIDDNRAGQIVGTTVDDLILGRGGDDTLLGRAGDDFLSGARGADWLEGLRGDDELDGGSGPDVLLGGFDNDTLQGGAGSDLMTGGPGADVHLFTRADFLDGGSFTDIIRGFNKDTGDQIVDYTGDLAVIAVGWSPIYNGVGTLIENTVTGDTVWVEDAILNARDISATIAPPPPDELPAGATRVVDPLELELVLVTAYNNGTDDIELYQIRGRNTSTETIANIDNLVIAFRDSQFVNVPAETVTGANYGAGRFAIIDGTQVSMGPLAETMLVQFEVINRPSNVRLNNDDIRTLGFEAVDPDGDVIEFQREGIAITIREFDNFDGGGSVEVFVRNVGNTPILDLDDSIFRFAKPEAEEITAVWGANEIQERVFDIIPWSGTDRDPLGPGEWTKLFGFTYEFDGERPDIQANDIRLLTELDDLLT